MTVYDSILDQIDETNIDPLVWFLNRLASIALTPRILITAAAAGGLTVFLGVGITAALATRPPPTHSGHLQPIRNLSGAGRARPVKGCASAACRGALDRAPTASPGSPPLARKLRFRSTRDRPIVVERVNCPPRPRVSPGQCRAGPSCRPARARRAAKEIGRR